MSIRNSRLAKLFYHFSERYLLPKVSRYFQTPNQLTSVGAGMAAVVPLGFLLHPLLGWLLLTLSAMIDVLDGHFARTTGRSTDFGAFWDSSLDRISDFFYLTGFLLLFRHDSHFTLASIMVGYAMATTFMISYVKARAESLKKRCHSGLMERGIRTCYLIIWSLVIGIAPNATGLILWIGLSLFCFLTTLTIVQRMVEIRSQFS